MTVLEALAILEAAVLECKKRNINTPEVREALNLLERYVRPAWLMLQFRHHALKERPAKYVERKVQQQVLLATFPGIRDLSQRADRKADGDAGAGVSRYPQH